MRKNNRKEPSKEVSEARRKVWRHNAMFGWARMIRRQAEMIIHSPTASQRAKESAEVIRLETISLFHHLKDRIDD